MAIGVQIRVRGVTLRRGVMVPKPLDVVAGAKLQDMAVAG